MPIRKIPLITDNYYHVYNRGINKQPIFFNKKDYSRLLEVMKYYVHSKPRLKYSKFLQLTQKDREQFIYKLHSQNDLIVEIVCFCLMPNHFHFLLKQLQDKGISTFMSNFQNSFTKYINTKYDRDGLLLQGEFKSVLVDDDAQLLHLSRYIHLNPVTSHIVRDEIGLINYRWSSYADYLNSKSSPNCKPDIILSQFNNNLEYRKFVEDRISYQRELQRIKHLLLEENL